MSLEPKPGILEIAPYVGGRASVPGVAKVHKLSSNESPLGPSPKALACVGNESARPSACDLRSIADRRCMANRFCSRHLFLPIPQITYSARGPSDRASTFDSAAVPNGLANSAATKHPLCR